MRWALAMAVLAGSSVYLYRQYTRMALPPPAPPADSVAPPVKPPPFLSAAEVQEMRRATQHFDPGVRASALEFLYTMGDPEAISYLERAIAKDNDASVRLKAVALLGSKSGGPRVPGLAHALKDYQKDVRLAALKSLDKLGDPAAAPWIAEAAAKDIEPDVRAEALRVLGRLQDDKRRKFGDLATQLRRQYETAVERSRQQQPQP